MTRRIPLVHSRRGHYAARVVFPVVLACSPLQINLSRVLRGIPKDREEQAYVLDAGSGLEKQAPVELFDLSSTSAAAAITNDNRFAAFCVNSNSYALADLPCLVAFVPVPPNVDMRAEKIMVSTEVGSPTSDDYNNRLYFYEVIEWDPNDPDDPNRPPDDQSDGAGALATGLLVMLPALAALAL